jgi:hypothetical protein
LAEATDDEQGLLLSMTGGQGRLRISNMALQVDFRPSTRPDTVIRVLVPVTRRTSVYTPRLAERAATTRVGGVEGWRTFLRMAPTLEDLVVPCGPSGDPGSCTVRLGDAVLNRAELLLDPMPPPAGYAPTESVPMTATSVLRPAFVPLERSPLAQVVGVADPIPASAFGADSDTTVVVDITGFLRPLLGSDAQAAASDWLALFSPPEGGRFGIGAFSGAPRLRLVLTVATEVQLR